jgi:PAS domain S-box-containing protein
MEGQLAAPLHFAVEFLILAVFAGAMFDAVRAARNGAGRVALVQAVGFATLVAAQVLHGTLVLTGEGSLPLVAMRAVGFGLIALSLRPFPETGLPAIFVAGPDASWAAIPAGFAIVAAGRAFALRREYPKGAGAALAASLACFAGGEIAIALAPPAGGTELIVAHVARAAGAVLLARWLWLSLVRSVRLRFIAVFVTALLLLASVVSGALTQVIGNNLEQEEFARLGVAESGQRSAFVQRVEQAKQFATLLGRTDLVRNAYQQNRKDLRSIAVAILKGLPVFDLDFVAFYDGKGAVLASATAKNSTYPSLESLQAIAIGGSESVTRVLRTRTLLGELTSSGVSSIAAIGSATITERLAGGAILGAIVVGYDIRDTFLQRLKVGAEADITIIKGGEIVATSYEDPADAQGLLSGKRNAIRRSVEEQKQVLQATGSPGGERAFVIYAPLTTENTAQATGVIALSRPATLLANSQREINSALFLITLAASALAAALAWLLSGRVTRPIRALTNAARRVRGGDLAARAAVEAPDEVGALGEAFNEMAQSLGRMTDDLRDAADEEANLRARMEAIMQSMTDAVVATDGDGVIVSVNRAAEGMLAGPGEDLTGRELADVLAGNDTQGRSLATIALGGNGRHAQASIATGDGRNIPVALTAAPLLDASGEAVGRVVVLRDVTREQEAERMKSEFLSNVSHELRTPLTPIKGYTEILRRKRFPRAKTEAFLDGIAESTKRLERIVEILVDFAAIEAGRLVPRFEPVSVRSFLDTVLAEWTGASATKHRLVRRIPLGLPPVLGDRRLLRKCLLELLDNAAKFSPHGGTIEVAVEAAPASGRRKGPGVVRISVRDHGIGIDASQMGRLFKDFHQLDGSETRPFGGLGLGLSYARRLALVHRGDITAHSEPGRGSTFTVELPAAQPVSRPEPREAATRIRRTRRIAEPRTAAGRKKVAAAKASRKKPRASTASRRPPKKKPGRR